VIAVPAIRKPTYHRVTFSLVAVVRPRYTANVNGARQALAIQMSAKQKPTQTIYVGVVSLGYERVSKSGRRRVT
jgi:hypothetical protein